MTAVYRCLNFIVMLTGLTAVSCSKCAPDTGATSRPSTEMCLLELDAQCEALSALLEEFSNIPSRYSAYVVKSPYANDIANHFRDHQPIVSSRIQVANDGARLIDAATGEPVCVFNVRTIEIGETAATIRIGAVAGDQTFAVWIVKLQRVGNRWIVRSTVQKLVT